MTRLERRLRRAALVILLGAVAIVASLFWHKPTAFLVFAGVGGAATLAGVAYYLLSILMLGRGSSHDGT